MGCLQRGVMVIIDGLGDRPLAELGGLTPLEAAHTPHLDALAARGCAGWMDPLSPGLPVATDVGVGLLMGMPVSRDPLPRGPIEALGVGLDLGPEDLAWRCNFASVQKEEGRLRILDRRAGRIGQPDTGQLTLQLNKALGEFDGVTSMVQAATGYRAVLVLRGEGLSEAVTDADPGAGWESEGVLRVRPVGAHDEHARRTARILNYFIRRSREVLKSHPINLERQQAGLHPANILLPRKGGRLRPVQGLTGHMRLRAAVVAGERTVVGLGRLLGMESIVRPAFTGEADTDLAAKVGAAQEALERNELVFLHVKATDIFSHDREPEGKRAFLERLDTALAPLLTDPTLALAVTGDHSTPCAIGRHSGDPVPTLLTAPGGRVDGVTRYGERDMPGGGLGRITAAGLLWSLLDQMGAVGNFRSADIPFIGTPIRPGQ